VQQGVLAFVCFAAAVVVVILDAPGQQWLGPTPDAVWQQVQQRVSAAWFSAFVCSAAAVCGGGA
jgi:hypothetical protein